MQGCNHHLQPTECQSCKTELPSICCCHVKFSLVQSSGICAYNHEILQMELGLFKFILVSSCPCTLPSLFINSHSENTSVPGEMFEVLMCDGMNASNVTALLFCHLRWHACKHLLWHECKLRSVNSLFLFLALDAGCRSSGPSLGGPRGSQKVRGP